MKKILVMSDSHGEQRNILRALQKFSNIYCVIHLGDYAKDIRCIDKTVKVYSVRGNCDIYSNQKQERVITIDGKKILAVHGHKQRVKSSLLSLGLYAREKEVDIALYGHTHISAETMAQGVLLYNPGSLSQTLTPTVGVVTIEKGKISIKTYKI